MSPQMRDFFASLGCFPTNNSFCSYIWFIYDCIFYKVLVFIQSLFFWNISHQGPALLKGIRVLLIAFWSSFTTALKLSLFYLSLLNPPVTFVIEPPTDPAAVHPGWKFRAALADRTPRGPKPPSGHLRVHSKLPPPPSPPLPCSRTLGYVN